MEGMNGWNDEGGRGTNGHAAENMHEVGGDELRDGGRKQQACTGGQA